MPVTTIQIGKSSGLGKQRKESVDRDFQKRGWDRWV